MYRLMLLTLITIAMLSCGNAQDIRATNEAAERGSTDRDPPLTDDVGIFSLRDGDCISSSLPEGVTFESTEITVCSGKWEYRVLSHFEVDYSREYPGMKFFDRQAYEYCGASSTDYIYPDRDAWSQRYRKIFCLQDSFGLSVSDPAKLDRLTNVVRLAIGACFNQAPETNYLLVERVACSEAWEFQVSHRFSVALDGPYPGDAYFEDRVDEECPWDYFFPPTAESWVEFEDRLVVCAKTP